MVEISTKYKIGIRRFGQINWVGFWTLYKKEVLRFLIVWIQTLLSPIVSSLLFLLVLSVAIGNERSDVLGVSFINFLAPGLIAMQIIQQSFSHSSSSFMIGKIQGNIVDIMYAPLSPGEVTFAISLADTNAAATTYGDNDVLVEIGELNTDHPDALVTATKFFIHKVVLGVTTAAASDANSLANLQLSATSGTATNTAISSGTEIVGAGVASFNPRISATDSVTEIDIDLDATAGTYHVFEPNISAAIASKHLYMGAGSTCDTALTAFRGTLEIEYSVF